MLVDMTEQRPEQDPDDTHRLPSPTGYGTGPDAGHDAGHDLGHNVGPGTGPGGPGTGSQHRYGEPGSSYSSPDHVQQGAPFGGLGFRDDEPAGRGARGGRAGAGPVAAILAAALVVGGLAGVVGAAGFKAADGTSTPASSSASSSGPASGPASSSPVVNRNDSNPGDDSVETVAKAVLPSVVKINVRNSQAEGSGSGIVISSDGEILTNNHVASVAGNGGTISVSFNDGTAKVAKVVGTDPLTDLAVIKAQGVSGLTPAMIGSSDRVQVGEDVVAIGSPFGLEATVTSGIVSALNRPVSVGSSDQSQTPGSTSGQDTTYPAIQTDAAINPGNSGGPLVDLNGDVVGINSSIRTASSDSGLDSSSGGSIGLGFAIPIDNVWPIVQQLRAGETPTHARMGVSVDDAASSGGLMTGAGIRAVTPGGAAAKAGLAKGDVITKVDDDLISGSESLVATVRGHRPGDKVTLTVSNGGKTRTVQVTLDSDDGATSR
jgi:putative serine protease PepD